MPGLEDCRLPKHAVWSGPQLWVHATGDKGMLEANYKYMDIKLIVAFDLIHGDYDHLNFTQLMKSLTAIRFPTRSSGATTIWSSLHRGQELRHQNIIAAHKNIIVVLERIVRLCFHEFIVEKIVVTIRNDHAIKIMQQRSHNIHI